MYVRKYVYVHHWWRMCITDGVCMILGVCMCEYVWVNCVTQCLCVLEWDNQVVIDLAAFLLSTSTGYLGAEFWCQLCTLSLRALSASISLYLLEKIFYGCSIVLLLGQHKSQCLAISVYISVLSNKPRPLAGDRVWGWGYMYNISWDLAEDESIFGRIWSYLLRILCSMCTKLGLRIVSIDFKEKVRAN